MRGWSRYGYQKLEEACLEVEYDKIKDRRREQTVTFKLLDVHEAATVSIRLMCYVAMRAANAAQIEYLYTLIF